MRKERWNTNTNIFLSDLKIHHQKGHKETHTCRLSAALWWPGTTVVGTTQLQRLLQLPAWSPQLFPPLSQLKRNETFLLFLFLCFSSKVLNIWAAWGTNGSLTPKMNNPLHRPVGTFTVWKPVKLTAPRVFRHGSARTPSSELQMMFSFNMNLYHWPTGVFINNTQRKKSLGPRVLLMHSSGSLLWHTSQASASSSTKTIQGLRTHTDSKRVIHHRCFLVTPILSLI